MFVVQPIRLVAREEELRSVRSRTRIRHTKRSRLSVLQLKVFVGKLLSVDGLSAGSVVIRKVTTLQHEARNDAMERRALVAETFFLRAQTPVETV